MTPQTSQLAIHTVPVRESKNIPYRTASPRKRSLPDTADGPMPGHQAKEYSGVIASTSALVAGPSTKRAKRAETRECPVCGERIPLRLLAQHYSLESSRVQTILDHVGDLEGFSDPYASAHEPYVCLSLTAVRRRAAAAHSHDASAAFASRLAKTLGSIKRRRKARNMALRIVTRDEDDVPVTGKGMSRTSASGQCPVCMQDVEGDPDVIAAHVDACLAHAELQRPGSSMDADADADAPLNLDDYADEDDDDLWEEVSETPDGVRRLRLKAGAGAGAVALGFVVGDRTVEDVDDEIDVEGDDLGAFGAAQFTEADILAEGGVSESSRLDTGRHAAEVEVDLVIERARHRKDSQALITALESKVRLLMDAPPDGAAFGCRICLEVYNEPTVSIGCWHACCSACWLRCLNATGLCPICKRITTRSDLRRIYL
ncbi:hypothetical protein BJV74DRAFT_616324 [Russula compacta]|nr:hypothetical protein BJV74DRAFT_616324 [Russula compacta]